VSESASHRRLVRDLVSWLATRYCDGDDGLILVDGSEDGRKEPPPLIGGYRSDAYIIKSDTQPLVIGEAKTVGDLERQHSLKQFGAYLEYCALHQGATLVLAVPWTIVPSGREALSTLKRIHKAGDVETIVIDYLSG